MNVRQGKYFYKLDIGEFVRDSRDNSCGASDSKSEFRKVF